MTSNQPAACCFQGVRHEGTPTGSIEKFDDIEAYIAHPKEKSEYGILLLTDVIGHKFNNAQLIADQFAANGYFTVIPDLFHGDAVPLQPQSDFDFGTWIKGGYNPTKTPHFSNAVDPVVEASLKELRTRFKLKKIGGVGYCFGAKYAVRHLNQGLESLDAAYIAHPSSVEKTELEAIAGPLAIAAAETDFLFDADKRQESEGILKTIGQPYQVNLYQGVQHGFAIRGDPKSRAVQYAKENAFVFALQWFEEHLKDQPA